MTTEIDTTGSAVRVPLRPKLRLSRYAGTLASTCALVSAILLAPVATASEQTYSAGSLDSPQNESFYDPPADFARKAPNNGDLIRNEPMSLALSLPEFAGPLPATAERLLYKSTNAAGMPIAVSGTYLRTTVPWNGNGTRPLASLAPGTQGQGDQCAPSKSFENGITLQPSPVSAAFGYEVISAFFLLSAGFDVVVTDYEGLGTPGVHTYVDRESQAHTVLDAARAVQRLPGTRLGPDTPVVYTGYSQGGGAAAAAAEEAARYAPDLLSVGASAGSVPADLGQVLDHIDGSLGTGVIGYAINGFAYSHPELRPEIDAKLNPAGRAMLDTVADQCLADTALQFGLHRSSEYTVNGESAAKLIRSIPEVQELIDQQKIGRVKPDFPVRLQSNQNDDAIAHAQNQQLGRDWCALGTQVEYHNDPLPPLVPGLALNHAIPLLTYQEDVVRYLSERVNGVAAVNSCETDPEIS